MKNKPSAIGDKIKEIRKDKGLTQKELGELLGVTASMIGQWESGIRFPRVANIYRIAEALDVPTDMLFRDFNYTVTEGLKTVDQKRHEEVMMKKHIELYRQLNEVGQHFANDFINLLLDRTAYRKDDENF
ncbi:MAG: helix-turn-helix transcriptional regulator [Emergencia sp.]|nr:helix-turn-helix transcriptional regulator [Emergencia sp.]